MTLSKEYIINYVKNIFEIDYNTGFKNKKTGKSNYHLDGAGYVLIDIHDYKNNEHTCINGHIVSWILVYGCFPELEIDHKNRNKSDNRIENLRLATRSNNRANIKIYANNKSGYKGITWASNCNKWRARIWCKKKQYNIGLFNNINEAAKAYNEKAKELFGDYACNNFEGIND